MGEVMKIVIIGGTGLTGTQPTRWRQ